MSRHLRRQKERDQRRKIVREGRTIPLPAILDEFTVFDVPQRILDQISNGSIDSHGGVPVFRDGSGLWTEVVPAFEGWIFTWKELNEKLLLGIGGDIEALNAVNKCLHYDMPISLDKIASARLALNACRAVFRKTERDKIVSIAKTAQIKIMLEAA